jgi:peptidoglycan L-alanyl-D-glutamate endopeptidase CwlK
MADFQYGLKSREKLSTCYEPLLRVAYLAIEMTPVDITIVHGWRSEREQNLLFESGASRKQWPDSEHNNEDEEDGDPCSMAIDFAPWINGTIPWSDTHAFAVVAGVFFAAAKEHEVTLRWGGDWDMDGSTEDQTLMDWGHVEIRI